MIFISIFCQSFWIENFTTVAVSKHDILNLTWKFSHSNLIFSTKSAILSLVTSSISLDITMIDNDRAVPSVDQLPNYVTNRKFDDFYWKLLVIAFLESETSLQFSLNETFWLLWAQIYCPVIGTKLFHETVFLACNN